MPGGHAPPRVQPRAPAAVGGSCGLGCAGSSNISEFGKRQSVQVCLAHVLHTGAQQLRGPRASPLLCVRGGGPQTSLLRFARRLQAT